MSFLGNNHKDTGTNRSYRDSLKGKCTLTLILGLLLVLMIFLSLCLGAASIGPVDLINMALGRLEGPRATAQKHIFLIIRFPRVLLAIAAGAGLSAAGAAIQAVLRNPLASSYTLGVSSAAGFGATLAIGLGMGIWGGKYILVGNAFVFGMTSMFLVYGIARIKGISPGTLILAGIAINYLFSALISLIKYMVEMGDLASIVFWLMGGLNQATWENTCIVFVLVLIPTSFLLLRYSWDLNVMSSGDEVATSLGVHPERTRIAVLMLATLITSAVVSFTGIIGFICLIGPHIARMLIGNDHRFLLPLSCLTGAVLLLASDTIGRVIMQPMELPVGIVTALLGVPFFLHLLLRSKGYWK